MLYASRLTKFTLASILLTALASCEAMPARRVPNPETIAGPIDDTTIVAEIGTSIASDPLVQGATIHVESQSGLVRLSGIVKTQVQEDRAVYLAKKVAGVKAVDDEITHPRETLGFNVGDTGF